MGHNSWEGLLESDVPIEPDTKITNWCAPCMLCLVHRAAPCQEYDQSDPNNQGGEH